MPSKLGLCAVLKNNLFIRPPALLCISLCPNAGECREKSNNLPWHGMRLQQLVGCLGPAQKKTPHPPKNCACDSHFSLPECWNPTIYSRWGQQQHWVRGPTTVVAVVQAAAVQAVQALQVHQQQLLGCLGPAQRKTTPPASLKKCVDGTCIPDP